MSRWVYPHPVWLKQFIFKDAGRLLRILLAEQLYNTQ